MDATGLYFYEYLRWATPCSMGAWSVVLARSVEAGSRFRVVPELDHVVVVTAEYYQDYSPPAQQVQSGIFRDVPRGISSPG